MFKSRQIATTAFEKIIYSIVASSVWVLPSLILLVGANPNPRDQHDVLATHFAKCFKNNPWFYTKLEHKNFRTTANRAEIFVDYAY